MLAVLRHREFAGRFGHEVTRTQQLPITAGQHAEIHFQALPKTAG